MKKKNAPVIDPVKKTINGVPHCKKNCGTCRVECPFE